MQKGTMTASKALSMGFGFTFIVMVGLLIWGLFSGAGFEIPGFLEMHEMKDAQGRPSSTMSFSPLGPILTALLVSGIIWVVGRARHGRSS